LGAEQADRRMSLRTATSITIRHSLYCLNKLLHIQVSAGDEPRMAGDGDVSYGRRQLLTLIRAAGFQLYLYSHIYVAL
jgi:hypothetical protein